MEAPSSYTFETSYDGGLTWVALDTVVNKTNWQDRVLVKTTLAIGTYPAAPQKGQLFYDETKQGEMRYDGAGWVPLFPKWKVVSAAYSAIPDDKLLVDTSAAAVTVTLPSLPQVGTEVALLDSAGTWGTNNVTVTAKTTIQGLPSPLSLTISSKRVVLVFNGTEWRL